MPILRVFTEITFFLSDFGTQFYNNNFTMTQRYLSKKVMEVTKPYLNRTREV